MLVLPCDIDPGKMWVDVVNGHGINKVFAKETLRSQRGTGHGRKEPKADQERPGGISFHDRSDLFYIDSLNWYSGRIIDGGEG
jgi:hypothetical protein